MSTRSSTNKRAFLAAMMGWMDPSLMQSMGFPGSHKIREAVDNVPAKARARWENDKSEVQEVINAILDYKKRHNLTTSKMARLLEIKPAELKDALHCGKMNLYIALAMKTLMDAEELEEADNGDADTGEA